MMKRFSVLILCLSYLAATVPSSVMAERQIFADGGRTNAKLAETKQERDARMKWWREARFGMFIHWGLYAVPAGEYKGQRSTRIGNGLWNGPTSRAPITRSLRRNSIPSSSM